MKHLKGALTLTILILTMMVVTSMTSSGFLGFGNSASWKEEVLLHDGHKIVASRSQTYGGFSEPASTERSLVAEEWVFSITNNDQKIIWKSNFQKPPEGESLMLLLFDLHQGVPYLATSPAGCLSYNHWGRPNPPYVFFKYDGKSWKRIPLTEFPSTLKESNVVVGRPDFNHREGMLSIETIKEENRLLEPHLRQIVREPLDPKNNESNVNCPDYASERYRSFKAPLPMSPANEK